MSRMIVIDVGNNKKIAGVNVPKCDLLYFVSKCLKIPHQINC